MAPMSASQTPKKQLPNFDTYPTILPDSEKQIEQKANNMIILLHCFFFR